MKHKKNIKHKGGVNELLLPSVFPRKYLSPWWRCILRTMELGRNTIRQGLDVIPYLAPLFIVITK